MTGRTEPGTSRRKNSGWQLKGEMVFAGNHADPKATAGAIHDGWLAIGSGVREEAGHARIIDRLKDIMITAGSRNLKPSESEALYGG